MYTRKFLHFSLVSDLDVIHSFHSAPLVRKDWVMHSPISIREYLLGIPFDERANTPLANWFLGEVPTGRYSSTHRHQALRWAMDRAERRLRKETLDSGSNIDNIVVRFMPFTLRLD